MTRTRFTGLTILLAALLAAVVTAATGTAFARPASSPQQHALNLHDVKWGNVAVPGQLCRVKGLIRLHKGRARVSHSGFGPLEVSTSGPVYGNLGHQQVAALQVWCANQGGTAAGQLAEGIVVYSGAGGKLHSLGTLTPQYRPRSAPHIPFVAVAGIGGGRIVTTEYFYTSPDADCCPSGRASTSWHWNGRSFKPGRTTVLRF